MTAERPLLPSLIGGLLLLAALTVAAVGGLLVALNPLHPHRGHSIAIRKGEQVTRYTVPGETTYDHQLAHMLDVMNSNAPPLTGGADAVANIALIDAVYAAAGVARP